MTIGLLNPGATANDSAASTGQDVADTVNGAWSSVNVSAFGVVAGNLADQSEKIQDCIDYAYDNNLVANFDVPTARIDDTIFLRGETRGNGVWILNYGTGDAISIASDSSDIHTEVSDINVTYKDHLSPLNPYVPAYTLNKSVDPRASLTWDHLASFTGNGFIHSTTGKTFKNLKRCLVYFHYYGFRPCGWSYIHEDCTATACFVGFENQDLAIGGTAYPANSIILSKCTYTSNQSFGLRIKYGSQIQLLSVNAEKNQEIANIEFFYCDGVSGSIYTEYARAYNSIAVRGLQLNVFSSGKKEESVNFFKTLQSVSEFTASGGGTTITVPAYNAGTGFGITGFSAMASTNVVVLKNYKWLARSAWSKSADVITVTTPYVTGDVYHIYADAYRDWTPTTNRVDPFLMSGGDFFIRLSSSIGHQVTGFVQNFVDGTFNVIEVGGIPDTSNIFLNTNIVSTAISRNNAKVSYDIRDGIYYNQAFFGGLSIRNLSDVNVTTNLSATIHYPSVGVGSVPVTNAHRFVFMLVTAFGSAVFTLDETGAISTSSPAQNKLTVQTTDAAAGGKLNIYSGTANTIRWNNLTGGAAQMQIVRLTY